MEIKVRQSSNNPLCLFIFTTIQNTKSKIFHLADILVKEMYGTKRYKGNADFIDSAQKIHQKTCAMANSSAKVGFYIFLLVRYDRSPSPQTITDCSSHLFGLKVFSYLIKPILFCIFTVTSVRQK